MENNVRVAERIFSIVELLAYTQKPMTLSLIAQELNLSKSTVHRLLKTMVERGYVMKNSEGSYTVGSKLIEIASYYINSLELQSEAQPFLSMLYSQINLSIHLGVLENFKLVYISKLDLYPTMRGFAKIGYETPAYCSSVGKCLLAALSGNELDQYLEQNPLTSFTAHTITDIAIFKEHLRQVRVQGWALDKEEYQIGYCCIGAPIYDYRGNVIASVGASGNTADFSDDKLPLIIHQVVHTAMQISKRMGYIHVI